MNLCKLLCTILVICITATSCDTAESKAGITEGSQQFSLLDDTNSSNAVYYEPDVYCNEFNVAYYRSSVHGGYIYTPVYLDYKIGEPRVMSCKEYIRYRKRVTHENLSR